MNKTLIGVEGMIKDHKHGEVIVAARYIDNGRRVRILTGPETGEVLIGNDFSLIEKIDRGEVILHK